MRLLITVPFFFLSLSAIANSNKFGKEFSVDGNPLTLKEAISQLKKNEGKEIVIRSEISQVCQSKGCWMKIKEGNTEVRVTFADYAFFVPKDSAKRKVLAMGKLFEKEISAAEARHYARDAKASEAEIKAIQTSRKEPRFEAIGLVLE